MWYDKHLLVLNATDMDVMRVLNIPELKFIIQKEMVFDDRALCPATPTAITDHSLLGGKGVRKIYKPLIQTV